MWVDITIWVEGLIDRTAEKLPAVSSDAVTTPSCPLSDRPKAITIPEDVSTNE